MQFDITPKERREDLFCREREFAEIIEADWEDEYDQSFLERISCST
ncbi:hypothetical protein [Thermofilum sp.]|jgi:hypothetical protein|nr:hypothetical protein [Thermofilum sp.]